MQFITEELEHLFRDNQVNPLEYLRVIAEFSKRYPLEEFAPPVLIREVVYRLSKDISYIIRENPNEAKEYLRIIKQLFRHYPRKPRIKEKIMDEPFFRISNEMDMELRDNPDSTLIYLELLLIIREYYQGDREEHMIERIVDTFRKREYPSVIFAKAAIILIQYGAPTIYIERLFDNHPKFRNLFSKSPELAKELLEATAELNNNERFN